LQHHLDSGKASQSSAFSRIIVGRTGGFVHRRRLWRARSPLEE
jgi:hypothetical protein